MQRWVCNTPACRNSNITVPHCPRCGFDQGRKSRDPCVLRNALFDGDVDTAVSEIRKMTAGGSHHQSSTRLDPIECFHATNSPSWNWADNDEDIPQLFAPIVELVKTGRYSGRAVNTSRWGYIPPIRHVKALKFLHRNEIQVVVDDSPPLPGKWMIYANDPKWHRPVIDVVEFLTSIRAIDPTRHIPALQWNDGIGAGLNDVKDFRGVWCIARVNHETQRIHFLMYDPDCDEDLTPATEIKSPYSMTLMPRGTTLSEMANGMMDNGRMAAGIARGLGVYYRNLTGLTERISPLLPFVPSLSKLVARYVLG